MPERQPKHIPDWAKEERTRDLAWIGENIHVFFPAAQQGFAEVGRGALIADTTTLVVHERGQSHPFAYVPSAEIQKHPWQDAVRILDAYDPSWEFVTILLKGNRDSVYRIGVPSEINRPSI